MTFLFWGAFVTLFYIYLGYPLLLLLVRAIKGTTPIQQQDFEPSVTLIISAYNEAATIRAKIKNSLALLYPRDQLEIFVVSDASSDETDQIVSEYASAGITLLRMAQRGGKTLGLNHAVSNAKGDIIIFSDANAFYHEKVVQKLVRNFADQTIGYATGASRYVETKTSFVGWCEDLYWNYDLKIKAIESSLGSMIGADGALYAIRKELYSPLRSTDINDFVNPLQIIEKGFRGIFEPEAICHEETVNQFGEEYRRKVRIVSRSLRGLMRVSRLLNPLRFGFYAIQLISHKLLRWLTPFFILSLALSNILLWSQAPLYKAIGLLQGFFYLLTLIGFILAKVGIRSRVFYLPYYFCLMNIASLHGMWKSLRGSAPTTWEPERDKKKSHEERKSL